MGRLKLKFKKALRLTERRKSALHEAGHALVASTLGYHSRADILRIACPGGFWTGGHQVNVARPYRDELAICFGGPVAEMLVGVPAKEAIGVSGLGDIRQINAILARFYPAGDRDRLWAEARDRAGKILVANRAKWQEVADALLRSEVVHLSTDLTVREAPEERAEVAAWWEGPGASQPLNAYPDPEPANDNGIRP